MTPAMTPAMPMRVKFFCDSVSPRSRLLTTKAKRKPVSAPTNNEGANVPPTPPAPLVADVANAFISVMAPMNSTRNQTLSRST